MSDLYPFRDDYISTAEIGRRLGFSLTAVFVIEVLGINPSFNTRSGTYWSPEQLAKVYDALIARIRAEAARSAVTLPPVRATASQMTVNERGD